MTTNVLVTGANGFFGKAVIGKLKENNVNIATFTRENDPQSLRDSVLKSDFIYHFAGETRPGLSSIKYEKSNSYLTQKILDILESENKSIPILFTSSIHSESQNSFYGKTKKIAEDLIENYSNSNSAQCYIYKLPHVFGPECKPNHNSVITTWMYNSIKDIDIVIYDRKRKMNYVYIYDIADEFIELLTITQSDLFLKPRRVFPTTLGDVINYIEEFKLNLNRSDYVIKDNEFKSKLYTTYQTYWAAIEYGTI